MTCLAGGAPLAVMDVAAAQAAFGARGQLSRVDLRLRPGVDREAFARSLQSQADWPAGAVLQPPGDALSRMGNVSRAYVANADPNNPQLLVVKSLDLNGMPFIDFNQLSTASFGARAVFANSCFNCHSSGSTDAAAMAKWDGSYLDFKNGPRFSVVNGKRRTAKDWAYSTTFTAPHQGIASKDLTLIKLWINQGYK